MKIRITREPSDELFLPRPIVIGLCTVIVIAAIFCSVIANISVYKEEADAIYKGYLVCGDEKRPIIEMNEIEYTSIHSQPVRDSAYVGHNIKVSYNKINIQDFIIEW